MRSERSPLPTRLLRVEAIWLSRARTWASRMRAASTDIACALLRC